MLTIGVWLAMGVAIAALLATFARRGGPESFDGWVGLFALPTLWLFFAPYVYVELRARADRLVISADGMEVIKRIGARLTYEWNDLTEVREIVRAHRRTFVLVFPEGTQAVFGTGRRGELDVLRAALRRFASHANQRAPRWLDRFLYL